MVISGVDAGSGPQTGAAQPPGCCFWDHPASRELRGGSRAGLRASRPHELIQATAPGWATRLGGAHYPSLGYWPPHSWPRPAHPPVSCSHPGTVIGVLDWGEQTGSTLGRVWPVCWLACTVVAPVCGARSPCSSPRPRFQPGLAPLGGGGLESGAGAPLPVGTGQGPEDLGVPELWGPGAGLGPPLWKAPTG